MSGTGVTRPRAPDTRQMRVLAVEDSAADARLLQETIADANAKAEIELVVVDRLAEAERMVADGSFDCVLVDLGLPDATGLDNVQRLKAANRWQTIVVMTGLDSEEAAMGNLQRGAQDYIVKGSTNGAVLVRILRRAIERNRVLSDIDKLREEQYWKASHDVLTGLPNRQLFMERARQLMSQADRHNQEFALGYLDLDGFKQVNDRYGHSVGDAVLRTVAAAAKEVMRDSDTVARVGGDEFQFLLSPIVETSQAERAMARVQRQVSAIRSIEGCEVRLGASVGLAFYPRDAQSLDLLVVHADQAMYAAKRQARESPPEGSGIAPADASAPSR